jgi:hypothetical protein
MRGIALAACALLFPALASGADLRPLANSDSITGEGFYVGQADGRLTFSRNSEVTYKLVIDAAGDRHYVDRHGSTYWIYDRRFKRRWFQGRELSPEQHIEFLPPDGKVEAGMAWDVPVHQTRAVCGFAEARFRAVASKGPDIEVIMDGKETPVPTIRIVYEAPLRCGESPPFLRTMEHLFSPELYEIIHSTTVNYDGLERGPLKLGDQGRAWRVTSIATSGGK